MRSPEPLKCYRIYRLDTETLKAEISSDFSSSGKLPYPEITQGLGCLTEDNYTACARSKVQALTQILIKAKVPPVCFHFLFPEAKRHTKKSIKKVKGKIYGKRETLIKAIAELYLEGGYRVGRGDSSYVTHDKREIMHDLDVKFERKYPQLVCLYERKLKDEKEKRLKAMQLVEDGHVDLIGEAEPVDACASQEEKSQQMLLFSNCG